MRVVEYDVQIDTLSGQSEKARHPLTYPLCKYAMVGRFFGLSVLTDLSGSWFRSAILRLLIPPWLRLLGLDPQVR